MTEEEVKKGREKYQELFNEKMDAIEIEDKIKRLEKNPYVKKYLSLKEEQSKLVGANCNVENMAFDRLANNTFKSNKILIYVGNSSKFINMELLYYYRDLETGKMITINKGEISNLEIENPNIIYPFGIENIESYSNNDYGVAYNILRDKFFESLLIDNQKECVEKVKKIKFTKKDRT